MWTEARIKQELDGNYWFFDQEGKLHHKVVERDWLPSYKKANPFGAMVTPERAIKWDDKSYDLIFEMRADNMTWPVIAKIFQVGVSTLQEYVKRQQRIRALQVKREADKIRVEEVRRMKSAGWNYSRIKKETGYDKQFIIDILEEE